MAHEACLWCPAQKRKNCPAPRRNRNGHSAHPAAELHGLSDSSPAGGRHAQIHARHRPGQRPHRWACLSGGLPSCRLPEMVHAAFCTQWHWKENEIVHKSELWRCTYLLNTRYLWNTAMTCMSTLPHLTGVVLWDHSRKKWFLLAHCWEIDDIISLLLPAWDP